MSMADQARSKGATRRKETQVSTTPHYKAGAVQGVTAMSISMADKAEVQGVNAIRHTIDQNQPSDIGTAWLVAGRMSAKAAMMRALLGNSRQNVSKAARTASATRTSYALNA